VLPRLLAPGSFCAKEFRVLHCAEPATAAVVLKKYSPMESS